MKSLLKELPSGVHTTVEPPCMGRNTRFAGAYAIHHPPTGKAYVGSTGDLYQRKKQHESMLRNGTHPNRPLQEAFDANPTIEFEFLLTSFSKEEAVKAEQLALNNHLSSGCLFNLSADAELAGKGVPRSAETIEKLRQQKLGKKLSEEHRQKLAVILKKTNANRAHMVSIDGVVYESQKAAIAALGVPKSTFARRLDSDKFPTWIDHGPPKLK